MSLITIAGVEIPRVTSYKLGMADLDSQNSARSEVGELYREIIRRNIATISFGCKLSGAQLDAVSAAIDADEFTATFRAPVTGGYQTATMYAGDRSITLITDTPEELWDFSVDLVEY